MAQTSARCASEVHVYSVRAVHPVTHRAKRMRVSEPLHKPPPRQTPTECHASATAVRAVGQAAVFGTYAAWLCTTCRTLLFVRSAVGKAIAIPIPVAIATPVAIAIAIACAFAIAIAITINHHYRHHHPQHQHQHQRAN